MVLHKIADRCKRIAAWISQGINVIFLCGHQNQTVSARCYVNRDKRRYVIAYNTINRIFFFQDNHCQESHAQDVEWAKQICSMSKQGDPKPLRKEYRDRSNKTS